MRTQRMRRGVGSTPGANGLRQVEQMRRLYGRASNDTTQSQQRKRPPAAIPKATATYAPTMVKIWAGRDWQSRLDEARHLMAKWNDGILNYGLPQNIDPSSYEWNVKGRNVIVFDAGNARRLRRIITTLLNQGAATVAGEANADYIVVKGDMDGRN